MDYPIARWAGGILGELLRRAGERPDTARLWGALAAGLLGALLLGVAGVSDNYLHRGVETSASEPYVVHSVGRGLAANADLLAMGESERSATIAGLQEHGFKYVRMTLLWSEVEPEPGVFNWEPIEQTLSSLEAAEITPVIVIRGAPEWALPPPVDSPVPVIDTPPADATDLGGFVAALATQFSGRLPFLQIWEHPNDPAMWGGVAPDTVVYASLLGEAANAARLASPGVQIVLAELAIEPTLGLPDIDYLRGLYRSGARDFFDVAAAVADGGESSPFDRQVDQERINLSRLVLFREVMVEEDDAATPIWGTRYGWAQAGDVDAQEQADFMVTGVTRAREEWPWLGLLFAWGYQEDQQTPADRALVVNGQPTLALQRISELATIYETADTGYTPLVSPAVRFAGDWAVLDTSPHYRTTATVGSTITFTFDGSGVVAYVRYTPDAGRVRVTLDGGPVPGLPDFPGSEGEASVLNLRNFSAVDVPLEIVGGLPDQEHELVFELAETGVFTVGGLVVVREVPTLWPIVLLAAAGGLLLFLAAREALYVLAWKGGILRRRREVELNRPEDW